MLGSIVVDDLVWYYFPEKNWPGTFPGKIGNVHACRKVQKIAAAAPCKFRKTRLGVGWAAEPAGESHCLEAAKGRWKLVETQESLVLCLRHSCSTVGDQSKQRGTPVTQGKPGAMLLLFESPAGLALFKVLDESKLAKGKSVEKCVKLKKFSAFEDTSAALEAATAISDSKLTKPIKKFLQKNCDAKETLCVADAKLGSLIKEKLDLDCQASGAVGEMMRAIRSEIGQLLGGKDGDEVNLKPMSLGLGHSLSRFKLKFSPDKVDTMIIQAIGLLDDLDKELNTYAMRVREWYGWHFPEMTKIVADNIQYAKCALRMGTKDNVGKCDFSDIVGDEVEEQLKEQGPLSMGTEISDVDLDHIKQLCEQVVDLSDYRGQLYDYLKSRMASVAPNLTVMVGELVGARLIAHAGSLMNLAKHPASTVQILGAEKALFRALKTKHETPKYGLIYHASLVGQSAPKHKGKISRVLAAKAALAVRVDALGDDPDTTIGLESRAKVEQRLRQLEGKGFQFPSQDASAPSGKSTKLDMDVDAPGYSTADDMVNGDDDSKKDKKKKKKRSRDDDESEDDEDKKEKKKKKKEKKKKKKDK